MRPWVPLAAALLAASPLAVVHPIWIEGRSMEPTLRPGELRWVLRAWAAGPPARDQVWLVAGPEGAAVKRLSGLPGERVRLVDGDLFVADRRLEPPPGARLERQHGAWDCGDGWFVLGDNRPASRDGRAWGPLPKAALKGRVIGI